MTQRKAVNMASPSDPPSDQQHSPTETEGGAVKIQVSRSPYSSSPYRVFFDSGECFVLPLDILRKSRKLASQCHTTKEPVILKAVPYSAGHTLVHYLYTGLYESLTPREALSDPNSTTELTHAIQVYAAARIYQLPGLEEQAKAQIKKYGTFSLHTILTVSMHAYPEPGEDDTWFSGYLECHLKPSFTAPSLMPHWGFLEQFNERPIFSQLLCKIIIGLYHQTFLRLSDFNLPSDSAGYIIDKGNLSQDSHHEETDDSGDKLYELLKKHTLCDNDVFTVEEFEEIDALRAKKERRGGSLKKKDRIRLEELFKRLNSVS